jgi:Gas vesicle synthesis protein GvpL/GvpF
VTLTYVYCLVRSTRRPSLRGVPGPLPGGDEIRLLDAGGGLWIVATHVPARGYDEAALIRGLKDLDWVARRAMAHEAVIEHFLRSPAVLPMKLFALFTSDERALAHIARRRQRLERVLARIERQLEWGLRLSLDERAGRAAAPRHSVARESGASYLSRKRDSVHRDRTHVMRARSDANRLYRVLAREATAARRRNTEQGVPGSRLLVDAAFLVPVRRTHAFRAALHRHAERFRPAGVVVSLTGPWPPYNFVDARGGGRGS